MTARRTQRNATDNPPAPLERDVQHAIRVAVGTQDGVLLLRNSVGQITHGKRVITYGLGTGSPDLVGMVTVRPWDLVAGVLSEITDGELYARLRTACLTLPPVARWLEIEVKSSTGSVRPEQEQWHRRTSRLGGATGVARGPAEALAIVRGARGL